MRATLYKLIKSKVLASQIQCLRPVAELRTTHVWSACDKRMCIVYFISCPVATNRVYSPYAQSHFRSYSSASA